MKFFVNFYESFKSRKHINKKINNFQGNINIQKNVAIKVSNKEFSYKALNFIETPNDSNIKNSFLELPLKWQDVVNQLFSFQNAGVIYACHQTYYIAKQFFKDNKIVLVENIENIKIDAIERNIEWFSNIGIISPYLVARLINSPKIIDYLKSICSKLILITDSNLIEESRLRQALHQSGFYEICMPFSEGYESRFENSSVGVLPDGTHDLYFNYFNLALKRYCVYIASRLPLTNYCDSGTLWRSIIGCPIINDNRGVRAGSESFVLIVSNTKDKSFLPGIDTISIEAMAKWEKCAISHASLVGNYRGPGDSFMYAALLQLVNISTVSVSLWKNDGKWIMLSSSNVIVEQEEKNYSLHFSLEISPSVIVVKVKDKILLSHEDTLTNRTYVGGIRLFNDVIAFSNISINKVRGTTNGY